MSRKDAARTRRRNANKRPSTNTTFITRDDLDVKRIAARDCGMVMESLPNEDGDLRHEITSRMAAGSNHIGKIVVSSEGDRLIFDPMILERMRKRSDEMLAARACLHRQAEFQRQMQMMEKAA